METTMHTTDQLRTSKAVPEATNASLKHTLLILFSVLCTPLLGWAALPTPILDLPLNGSLDIQPAHLTVSTIGSAASFSQGILDPEQAILFDGNTALNVDGLANTTSNFTLSAWVLIDDLREEPEITLMESQGSGNTFRWYFNTSDPTVLSNRLCHLVFEVDGNSGGNGPTDNSIQSLYRRFGEHEVSYQSVVSGYHQTPERCWFHVALSYDSTTKTVTTFLHGELGAEFQLTTAQAVSFEHLIIAPIQHANQQFHGRLRDVKLYDSVLTHEQVRTLGDFIPKLWAIRDIENWEAPQTTFYVDNSSGSDTNNGSQAAPFKTIKKGLSAMNRAGTKLLIAPGTYYESELQLKQSGTRFKPVIIEAEIPGTVIIDGASSFNETWSPTGTANRYTAAWTNTWGYTLAQDLGHRRELFLQNGAMLTPVDSISALTDGSFYVDETNSIVTVQTTANPTTDPLQLCNNEFLLKIKNLQYVAVRGLTFQHCGGFAYSGAFQADSLKHFLAEDCTFLNSNSAGLTGGSNYAADANKQYDYVIRRCNLSGIGGSTIKTGWGSGYVLVEDCASRNSYWRIKLGNDSNPSTFGKNLFSGHIMYRRLIFENNKTIDLWIDHWNWDITVDQSTFYKANRGIWYEINPQGCVIRNTSVADCITTAISLSTESALLENNYIRSAGNGLVVGAPTFEGGQRAIADRTPYLHNYYEYFKNNIIVSTQWGDVVALTYHPDTLRRENNQYYTYSGSSLFRVGSSSYTWNRWKKLPMVIPEIGSTLLSSDPFTGVIPQVGFTQSNITVQESNAPLIIPINMSAPANQTMQVTVQATSGTATDGNDFRLISDSTLKFLPLQIYHTAAVAIYRDDIPEGLEQFTLHLTNPQNATLGTHSTLTVTIEQRPTITIANTNQVIWKSTPIDLEATATDRNGASVDPASISWSSSIDGDLGTGSPLTATLSAGLHTLTASYTKQGTVIATDSIPLLVRLPSGVLAPQVSGLSLWLDANDIDSDGIAEGLSEEGLIATNKVSIWNMKNKTNKAVQYEVDRCPQVITNAYNGQPTLRFDGINDLMFFDELNDIRTAFWVVMDNSGPTEKRHLLGHNNSFHFHRSPTALWNGTFAHANIQNGSSYINGIRVNGTKDNIPKNQLSMVSLVTTGNVEANQLTRDRWIEERSWKGDMCEIIISNQALSDTERQAIEAYLHAKWIAVGQTFELQDTQGQPIPSGAAVSGERDFGSVPIGNTAQRTFTIYNAGTNSLTLGKALIEQSAFTFASDPTGQTIPAQSNMTLTITFAPQTLGRTESAVLIGSNDPNQPLFTVKIAGTGSVAPLQPSLHVVAGSPLLQWAPSTGQAYRIEWTDNLTNAFQLLQGNIAPPINSYTDLIHNADHQGFYRIQPEP